MSISHDPDELPEFDLEGANEAARLGLKIINVICEEGPGARVGDPTGVQFVAYAENVPRQGERIILQDGTYCQVVRVIHKVVKRPGDKFIGMTVNVVAHRVQKGQQPGG